MAGSAADFTESPIERLAFRHAGDAEHPRPVMSAGDQNDGAQAALSGSYRETATPSRSLAAALPSSILIRKPASLRGSGLRRTVEASRPEGANPPAGSSGFPCSLPAPSALRNLASGLATGALDCLGSIPWLERSQSCRTIQVLFWVSAVLQCGRFMARAAGAGRGQCLPDRAAVVNRG